MRQTTLRDRVVLEGCGVHNGATARLVLQPADAGTGVAFLRALPGGRERLIEARYGEVATTEMCTVLGGPEGVSTVEHLMAALAGLGVDNCLVEVDGPEVPILDGSAAMFVDAIDAVGVEHQSATRRAIKVLRPVRAESARGYAELRPSPKGFQLDVEIDFPHPVIGHQRRHLDLTPATFRAEVARARTFGILREVEGLWRRGLALGASLDNTVAVGDDGVVNPEGLRFADEFVRHKILDAVGDLALAGRALQGAYRARCPGHGLNVAVLRALFADRANYAVVEAPATRRDPARSRAEPALAGAVLAPEVA